MKGIAKLGLAAWAAAVALAWGGTPDCGAEEAGRTIPRGRAHVPVSFDANGGHFTVERWNEATETFAYETPTVMTNAGEWTWVYDYVDEGYSNLSYQYGGNFQKPVRAGYAFDGWYTEKIGGELAEGWEGEVWTSTRTVYAHWARTNTVSLAASVDATNLTFVTGGDAPWFGQTNGYSYSLGDHNGPAARSGSIGDNEISWMETTVTGPGWVEFSWGTSCEDAVVVSKKTNYYDYVSFTVDGVEVARLAGVFEYDDGIVWDNGYLEFGWGKHTLRWQYQKDGAGSSGHDCAWVEDIQWCPTDELEKALDTEDLTFRSWGDWGERWGGKEDGEGTWGLVTDETHDGVDAACTVMQYDLNGHPAFTNAIETTVTGPGVVSFWWKACLPEYEECDDEDCWPVYYHFFDFAIDGRVQSRLDGRTYDTWRHKSFSVPEGEHTLLWYEHGPWSDDASSWLDQVVWTPAQQTLTFDANGGSCGVATMVAAYDGVYGPLPTPSWSNHVFQGWYTAPAGGSRVENGQQVTPAAFRTLYARWAGKQATTFVVNGSTAASTVRTNAIGGTYGAFPAVTRQGYELLGWFTAASGGSRVAETSTVTVAEARTLYAHWKEGAGQTVTFNANGGKCGTATKEYRSPGTYGELPTATRSGMALLGWFTDAAGGTEVTVDSAVTAETKRTLWAHWTDRQVTSFNGNGGKPTALATTNTIYADYGTLPEAKWSGHAFLGWFNQPEGGKRVYTNSTVTLAATRTLYAQWTDQQVTTFKANGGYPATQKTTNTIYEAYAAFPAVKYSGHALVGWFNAPEGGKRIYTNSTATLAATRTLYAQWTTNQVTTFKGNGGTPEIQKTTNAVYTHYGTLPEAAWENHVFLGWFNHPTKGKRVYTNTTVTLAATRSLYAHWTDKQVVTLKGNGGSPATAKTTNTMGKAYGPLPTPKKSGHALLGWFTAADGGDEVTAEDLVTTATARTLYAHWTDQQVTTYMGNGGTPETQAITNTIYAKYAFPPTPAWEGHTFQGWYNTAEGGKQVSTNSTVTLAAARTLYAHWTTAKGFAITAIAVGADGGNEGPAPRAVRSAEKAENTCRLRFELSAGTGYEIQWTASMAGEWETVERLTAETDGEVEVEIEVPGGEKGFFRLVTGTTDPVPPTDPL